MSNAVLDNSWLDFVQDMRRARSVDSAWSTTITYMRGLGVSHVGNLLELQDTGLFHLNTSSPRVSEIYREHVYPDHDPKREHCRKNVTPYFFGQEFWSWEPKLSKERQWVDEELADTGGRALVAIPIHMPASRDRGHLSMATNYTMNEFVSFYSDRHYALHLGAITAFNRIYELVKGERASRVNLTERERECLLWLTKGLHTDRIAERMNVRPVTVEFHLANVRRKLNSRTSGQALARAVQLGLIEP